LDRSHWRLGRKRACYIGDYRSPQTLPTRWASPFAMPGQGQKALRSGATGMASASKKKKKKKQKCSNLILSARGELRSFSSGRKEGKGGGKLSRQMFSVALSLLASFRFGGKAGPPSDTFFLSGQSPNPILRQKPGRGHTASPDSSMVFGSDHKNAGITGMITGAPLLAGARRYFSKGDPIDELVCRELHS